MTVADQRGVDLAWEDFKATGDRASRDHLAEQFTPLVRQVAASVRRGLPRSVEAGDLEADGTIGLLDAIEKFEPDRGHPFTPYAARRIRGAILDGLRATDWVPRSIRDKIRAINLAVVELERRHGRSPSDPEVAAELHIDIADLRSAYAQTSYTSLLSLEHAGLGDELTPHSVHGLPGADDGVPAGFVAAVRDLPERDQIVVALHYWDRLTLTEIGQVLGVSESRVSQLHHRATTALRQRLLSDA